MRLGNYHIFRYQLPFVNPIEMMAKRMTFREGFILKLESATGAVGYGEVAPFPGLSKESLPDALEQLRHALNILKHTSVELSFPSIPFLLNDSSPSVLFGVESAILGMQAQEKQTFVAKVLNPTAADEISIQALLVGDYEDIVARAQNAVSAGFQCLKLKVGRFEIDKAIELVLSINKNFNNISLRLDANRAWSLNQAVQFCDAVHECNIEYIEEPLQNPADILDLRDRTTIPFALDESLTWDSAQKLSEGIAALVLKPGIHGGVSRIIQYINLAQARKQFSVLSCPFYSAIGLNVIAQLAAAFIPALHPMGLNTFDQFAQDLTHQPIQLEGDKLKLQTLQENLNVDSELLESL